MKKKTVDVSKSIKASKLIYKTTKELPYNMTLKANNYLLNKYFLRLLLFATYIGLLLPLFCIIVDSDFSSDFSYTVIALLLFVIFGLVLVYIILFFTRRSAIKKHYEEKANQKFSVSYYKKGIIRQDASSNISYLYSDLKSIEENKEFLFINPSKGNSLLIAKETLKPEQYAFFISIKEELSRKQKDAFEKHVNYKPVGFILIFCLFILSIFINYKSFYSLVVATISTFLILRVSQIIYERYINYLDTLGLVLTSVLSIVSVFIGQYLYYVSYYYSYFSIDGSTYSEVFFGLFSMIEFSSTMTYLKYSIIVAGVAFLINIFFIYKPYMKRYILVDNSKKLEHGTHIAFKTKNTVIYLLTLMFFVLNVFNFKDVGPGSNEPTIYGFSGYYLSTPLSTRYANQVNRLKDIDQAAYKEAYNCVFKQTTYNDFNVDNYYINVVNKEDFTISIYANLDAEDYILYHENYDYEDLKTESEWTDWYEIDGDSSYIDINVHVTGEGYSVIVISNDYDDRVINVFIDCIKNIDSEPDNSAGPGTMYFIH